jgi:hypothetical protein
LARRHSTTELLPQPKLNISNINQFGNKTFNEITETVNKGSGFVELLPNLNLNIISKLPVHPRPPLQQCFIRDKIGRQLEPNEIIVSGSKIKCGYLIQSEELAGSDCTPIIELKG